MMHKDHLFFKDRDFQMPTQSLMSQHLINQSPKKIHIHRPDYSTRIPLEVDKERDAFYKNGGTYNS